jgi:hypothetical protein
MNVRNLHLDALMSEVRDGGTSCDVHARAGLGGQGCDSLRQGFRRESNSRNDSNGRLCNFDSLARGASGETGSAVDGRWRPIHLRTVHVGTCPRKSPSARPDRV